jgi:hypothetical protein
LATTVQSGVWRAGMAYLRVTSPNPMLFVPVLMSRHELPVGMDRRFEVSQFARPVSGPRWVGEPADRSHSEGHRVRAGYRLRRGPRPLVRRGPVDARELFTGGSVALRLDADHPGLVRRPVLVSSACRLGRTAPRSPPKQPKAGRKVNDGFIRGRGMPAFRRVAGWFPTSRGSWADG